MATQPGYLHTSTVAAALVATAEEEKEKIPGFKNEEDIMKGLTYEDFNETCYWKVIEGTDENDFATMVKRIAIRLDIPDDVKRQVRDAILDGLNKPLNNEFVLKFNFPAGSELNTFTYGRFSTLYQEEDVIDLAYAVYHVQFKLSPVVTEHEKKTKCLLFFTSGKTEKWTETTDRALTGREEECLQTYFLRRAIDRFRKSYAGLIEPQSSKERSCCVIM